MSTRCAITFSDGTVTYPVGMYKHSDGYPEGQQWLLDFAKDFNKERGDDLEYAAAQCMAQVVMDYAEERKSWGFVKPEDKLKRQYLGVGAFAMHGETPEDIHGDLQYVYRVELSPKGGKVFVRPAGTKTWKPLRIKKEKPSA